MRIFTSKFSNYFGSETWFSFFKRDKNSAVLGKFWEKLSILL